jgi:hypothetical protein
LIFCYGGKPQFSGISASYLTLGNLLPNCGDYPLKAGTEVIETAFLLSFLDVIPVILAIFYSKCTIFKT